MTFINTGVFLTCDRTTEAFINRWLQVYGSGIYVWTVDERRVAGMDVMEKILTGPRLPRLIWRSFRFVLGNVGLGYGTKKLLVFRSSRGLVTLCFRRRDLRIGLSGRKSMPRDWELGSGLCWGWRLTGRS